jgi:hypothetical protein
MLRYNLRTLVILLAIGPPMLARAWEAWRGRQIEVTHEQLLEAIRHYKKHTGDFPPQVPISRTEPLDRPAAVSAH